MMALAECSFRMAVHPDTSDDEAVSLLQNAVRLDGTNPRYAYHLGRIELRRGRLQEAARWYRIAVCLAPTSHRIWAHIAVLQRELNESFKGNENFEPNVLLNYSEAILSKVREGQDNIDPELLSFVPPKSLAAKEQEARQGKQTLKDPAARDTANAPRPSAGVRRYMHSGICRWSGIDQLFVEQMLEGRPTQSNIKSLAPVLQRLAENCREKSGGPAALAVLLVQWILAGYPVATVRRLTELMPPHLPSRRLLNVVCDIFEAADEEIPGRIRQAIEAGAIPSLIGSLIHRERILWRPLEFSGLGAYRAAQRLLAKNSSDHSPVDAGDSVMEDAREIMRRLESAIETFLGTEPRKLKDEIPAVRDKGVEPNGPALLQQFSAYVDAALRIEQFRDEGFRILKEDLESRSNSISTATHFQQLTADRLLAERFLELLASQTTTCLERFEVICKQIAALDAFDVGPDFSARREECVGRLQGISSFGKFVKVLKRIDGRLSSVTGQFSEVVGSPSAASAEWSALVSGLSAVVPDQQSAASSVSESPSLADRFSYLEAGARGLTEIRESFSDLIRTHFEPVSDEDQGAELLQQRAIDATCGESILRQIEESGQLGLNRAEELRQEAAGAAENERPEEFDIRLERTINQFRTAVNLGSLKRRLMKATKRYLEAPKTSRGNPSSVLSGLCDRFDQLFGDGHTLSTAAISELNDASEVANEEIHQDNSSPDRTTASKHNSAEAPEPIRPSEKNPEAPGPVRERTPLEGLANTVRNLLLQIDTEFGGAAASLTKYPQWIQRLPAFRMLSRRIHGRHAEILYRLGRRRPARALWNQMLCADRLDAPVLKNMAVCDTINSDVDRYLQSWKEYLELLYLYDIIGRTPRPFSAARVAMHRAFGNAYAPAFLSRKFDHEWSASVEPAALLKFLNDQGRVRSFLRHRLLEYLNSRFMFRSPPLILGIKRGEAESLREAGLNSLSKFAESVTDLIPHRVAQPFIQLALGTFKEAATICGDSRRMTLEALPWYAEEETQQIELLVRLLDINLKLAIAFRSHANLVRNISSLDFITELSELQRIPLESSPELFTLVANTMGIEATDLADISSTLKMNIVVSFIKYLLEDDEESEREVRQRQYKVLTGPWLQTPGARSLIPLVDNPPPNFMPAAAAEALREGGAEDVALKYLRAWNDLFPAMAGLCTMLGNILIKQMQLDEAYNRLERTRHLTLHPPTRRYLHFLLVQILIRRIRPLLESEAYEQAFNVALEMIRLDDCQPSLIRQFLPLYVGVSQRSGKSHRCVEFRAAVNGWIERATVLLSYPAEESALPVPTAEQIEEIRKEFEETIAKVAQF